MYKGKLWALAIGLIFAFGTAGCFFGSGDGGGGSSSNDDDDECDSGDYECDGDELKSCDDGEWESEDCDDLCVEAGYDYSTECAYSDDLEHDACFCDYGSGGDADADGDSDGDSDADSDSDADGCGDCPMNSGYPCPCNADCDDGSTCGTIHSGDTTGVCLPQCSGDADCDPGAAYSGCAAVGSCALTDGTNQFCGYTCSADGDCPGDQYCDTSLGIGICYANQ